MKLSAALTGYWLDKQLEFSPNTVRNYSYVFRYLRDFLGDREIEKITSDDVRRFLIYLGEKRKMGKRSIHDAWIPLSSLWTWAEKELHLPHIIRGRIAEPSYTETLVDPFTADEVARLVEATGDEMEYTRQGKVIQAERPNADRDRALVMLLADTGVRASEFCDLTVGDYNAQRGRLHVRDGKGGKQRYVIVGLKTRRALWKYLATRPGAKQADPLFVTHNGKMHREGLYQLIVRLGERAKVTNAHPHRFRHFYAITFLRSGGNVLLLQELLGHESLEMVTIYARIAEQDVEGAGKFSPVDNMRI